MSDADPMDEPVINAGYAKTITWRVFNEEVFSAQAASKSVFTRVAVSGRQNYELPQRQSLSSVPASMVDRGST